MLFQKLSIKKMKQQQKHPKYPERCLDKPVYFTHEIVCQNINVWADPFWNDMTDEEKSKVISKVSSENKKSLIFENKDLGRDSTYNGPINPKGKTGIVGRGLLGRYGPNYAADPIVTRFNKEGILEMVAIQRSDTGQWAIPGGMVEKGDTVSETLRKEFNEEALGNTLGTGDAEYVNGVHDCSKIKSKEDSDYINKIKTLKNEIDKLFSNGTTVYAGFVDDPRNTDWAWMETVAVHFHIKDDSPIHDIELRAATDATSAKWYKIKTRSDLDSLYASHALFVTRAIENGLLIDKRFYDIWTKLAY